MIVQHNNKEVYLISGDRIMSNEKSKECYKYNVQTTSMTSIADILTPRCYAGIACLNNFIYVVSGQGLNKQRLKSCERYSISKNQWTEYAPIRACRPNPTLIEAGGRFIFMIGGSSSDIDVIDTKSEFPNWL
jgi:hypothetical protein